MNPAFERVVVPAEIDRAKHAHVLAVWNACMENCESLEMAWPKLVEAMQKGEPKMYSCEVCKAECIERSND